MSKHHSMQDQIIARAMKDEMFRQGLLDNPQQTLERELGITLPPGVTIQVHEDMPTILHLVLPSKQSLETMQELSDAELEQAAGGVLSKFCCVCATSASEVPQYCNNNM